MASVSVAPLRASQLDGAAAALARAFQHDPLQSYVFPDPVERAARSPAHFMPLLEYGRRFGEVLTTAGASLGASVWLPPFETDVTPARAADVGLNRLPELIGEEAAARFRAALGSVGPVRQQDVEPAHWYVMVLGVAPEAQGQGVGRALLQPMLDRADRHGYPCCLETWQPRNVTFYEHLGFRVRRDAIDRKTGLRLWTLRRDPSASPRVWTLERP